MAHAHEFVEPPEMCFALIGVRAMAFEAWYGKVRVKPPGARCERLSKGSQEESRGSVMLLPSDSGRSLDFFIPGNN